MSPSDAAVDDHDIAERLADAVNGYVFEAQGLLFTRALTQLEWEELGRRISHRHESSQWALGDWLIEGGRDDPQDIAEARDAEHAIEPDDPRTTYATKAPNGYSVYARAMRLTGYDESQLARAYTVCRAFIRGRRVPGASFYTHHLVMPVPTHSARLALLERYARERPTATQADLRAWVDNLRDALPDAALPARFLTSRAKRLAARVTCPACQHVFSVKGHQEKRGT